MQNGSAQLSGEIFMLKNSIRRLRDIPTVFWTQIRSDPAGCTMFTDVDVSHGPYEHVIAPADGREQCATFWQEINEKYLQWTF